MPTVEPNTHRHHDVIVVSVVFDTVHDVIIEVVNISGPLNHRLVTVDERRIRVTLQADIKLIVPVRMPGVILVREYFSPGLQAVDEYAAEVLTFYRRHQVENQRARGR